ncbi:MAG: hypothetical protein R2748_35550 [Bryobacterales bacterium]
MSRKSSALQNQLGFDGFLAAAEADNRNYKLERETAHLPGAMDDALPFFRALLDRHHAAMLAGGEEQVMRHRDEAEMLALRLNGFDSGILAGPEASGSKLERETAADPGNVPIWGQAGEFMIALDGMRVRIELDGVFGIGCGFSYWPGFSAHAVDWDRPFLSETGYRSFLGVHWPVEEGLTPDVFIGKVLSHYIAHGLKEKLVLPRPLSARRL